MSLEQISYNPQPRPQSRPQSRPLLRLVVDTQPLTADLAPVRQPMLLPEEVGNEVARRLPTGRLMTEAELAVIGLARQRMLDPNLSPTERTQAVNEYWASHPMELGASRYQFPDDSQH